MARNQKETTSIIEPTEAELSLYNQLLKDLTEEQLDEFANEYFDLVQKEECNCSFPKFVIDKLIRPVKPGDTISFIDENNEIQYLFCSIRQDIETKTYLLFSLVDKENDSIIPEQTYLFFVNGYDENGIEEIDIMMAGDEAERILNIIEASDDIEMIGEDKSEN
jgi:hypothetical protein